MAVVVPGAAERLRVDFGNELICRRCFVRASGAPRRLARMTERPGHQETDRRKAAYCYVLPPGRDIDDMLDELDRAALSLEQLLSWVKEQEARIIANAPAHQPPPGMPSTSKPGAIMRSPWARPPVRRRRFGKQILLGPCFTPKAS